MSAPITTECPICFQHIGNNFLEAHYWEHRLRLLKRQDTVNDLVATNPEANTDLLKSALSNPKSKAEGRDE